MDLEKVRRAFKRNRFDCSVFETKEEAADYLDREIDGVSVGVEDSETLTSMGISDRLSKHNVVYDVQKSDHFKRGENSFLSLARKALTADVFLTSVNGASETGVLVNLDGTGNRVSGSIFGHKKVYFVFGMNKLAPTLEDAIYRARNVAAPKNVERHHFLCGCTALGFDRCYDCGAPDRICNVMAIYYKKMRFMDMEVVIINEELGL